MINNGTINGAAVNGAINQTVNGTVNGSINASMNATVNGSVNGSLNGTVNGTANAVVNGSINGNFDCAIGRRGLALNAPRGISGPKAFACDVCECEPRKLRDSGVADRKFHSSMEAG